MKKDCKVKSIQNYYGRGASIKDKHREDNTHTDHMDDVPKNMKVVKIRGVLNSDWKQEWGGGFTWNGKTYYANWFLFYFFDPRVPHRADDILCDEKRIALTTQCNHLSPTG